jgi:hypothetical protein
MTRKDPAPFYTAPGVWRFMTHKGMDNTERSKFTPRVALVIISIIIIIITWRGGS